MVDTIRRDRTSVVVVMPVHNRKDLTLGCLRSIQASNHTGLVVHCIVVDDGSTDGTADAIHASFPKVEVLRGNGSLWYTGGTNRGIEHALRIRPDYILATNDDTVFDSECIRHMVDSSRAHPHTVIGAVLMLQGTQGRVFQVAPEWHTFRGGWRYPQDLTIDTVPAEPFEVQAMAGNCVLFPRSAIEAAGLMDEKAFRHVFSDAEYTCRLKKLGWHLLIEPSARLSCAPNVLKPALHTLSFAGVVHSLLFDWRRQDYLPGRFRLNWRTAPSPWRGALASLVDVFRLGCHMIPWWSRLT